MYVSIHELNSPIEAITCANSDDWTLWCDIRKDKQQTWLTALLADKILRLAGCGDDFKEFQKNLNKWVN